MLLVLSVGCQKKSLPAVLPPASEVETTVSLDLGPGARVLYYFVDTGMIPGLNEWIVEAPAFDWKLQKVSAPLATLHDSTTVQKIFKARLPSLPVSGAASSARTDWESATGSRLSCTILTTQTTTYLLISKYR